jgi:hypothetical protein
MTVGAPVTFTANTAANDTTIIKPTGTQSYMITSLSVLNRNGSGDTAYIALTDGTMIIDICGNNNNTATTASPTKYVITANLWLITDISAGSTACWFAATGIQLTT